MMISKKGLDFIKLAEGVKLNAYQDSVGIWTIGYGTIRHDGQPVRKGDTCTPNQAEAWLSSHIATEVEPHINKLVKVKITQDMFDVFCSFIYNLGWGAFSTSTMLKLLNAGDYKGAAAQILHWNKEKKGDVFVVSRGLDKRRKDEYEIFVASINDINSNIG